MDGLRVFCGIVFLSFFVVIKRKNLWKKWAALILSFVLLSVVINTTEKGNYTQRVNSVITDSYKIASNQSTGREGSSRLFIWEKSAALIKPYFLFGSGPDTLQYVFPATPEELQIYLSNRNAIVDKVHNEYLQMAVTLGIPALLTYLLLLTVVIRQAFKAVKKGNGKEKIFLYGLISTIFGYLVQAFFNISTVPVAPLFWAILGITMAISTNVINNNEKALNSHKYEPVNNNQIA